MNHSIKVGVSFGLNSGVITTLGLIVGLYAGTQSTLAVIGGIITIAIADAFSDALGIHVSEETEGIHTKSEIWQSTIATFVTKFIIAISFLVPVLILPLTEAVIASIVWGISLVAGFSYLVARNQNENAWKMILEHLTIAIFVIIVTYFVGIFVDSTFS
ncbi:MAG: hypothetical protein GOU98_04485 [Candidatus Altiarchaeota archaeon]|nr:hypothetical protein [Candidatus Altiarchaeota archaeon]